ncbi:MAG: hypothetical protein ABW043_12300 [Devosia sp.]|uniref:hypothetical protein n=1 Tax=Devosia sp. TaxID=1871048 RepID=UPI003392FCA8
MTKSEKTTSYAANATSSASSTAVAAFRSAVATRRATARAYYLYGHFPDSNSEQAEPIKPVTVLASNSASTDSNYRAYYYAALYEALQSMAEQEEGDALYVTDEAANAARGLISRLAIEGIDPPKINSHDKDEVILSWAYPDFKRYLTVFSDDAALLDVGTLKPVKCVHNDLPHFSESWGKWSAVLGGTASSHGTLDDDVE